jgi:hypothetical protein
VRVEDADWQQPSPPLPPPPGAAAAASLRSLAAAGLLIDEVLTVVRLARTLLQARAVDFS